MRILFTENETDIIQAFLPVLQTLPNAEVRVATSGGTGLQAAMSMGGVDLLITDVVMEPMDGFTLRDHVLGRFPNAKVLLISGYDLTDYQEQLGGCTFLQKPFDAEGLLQAIENAGFPLVAKPVAVAVPQAVPVAAARPAAPAVAVHAPQLVTQGATVQVAAAQPRTVPPVQARVVLPPSQPVPAAPQPVPMVPPAAPPPRPQAPLGADMLMGSTFGPYQIMGDLGRGRWGQVYSAIQISINRPVTLKILSAEFAADPFQRARFVEDARAKAHVEHAAILSVFEAGEFEGRNFCAHEYVEGEHLEAMQAVGRKISEAVALKTLRTISEAFVYLHAQKLAHSPLEAAHIYLGSNGHVHLSNIATHRTEPQATPAKEIQTLARVLLSVLPSAQGLSQGLRTLIGQMVQSGQAGFTAWGPVLQRIKALEPKIVPVEVAKISAQDQAAIAAVEAARKAQKRSLRATAFSLGGTFLFMAWALWFFVFRTNERNLDIDIPVPAGEYTVGTRKVYVAAFSIDKYEVTIGQYQKFLEYLEHHPSSEADYTDPRQPRQFSHEPNDWKIYYLNAVAGRRAGGVLMSLNSPMLKCTWWDAYAYAGWKGRELPTEEQWEAAARGPQGFLYPWGNQPKESYANAISGYDARNPSAKGGADGYNHWADVDAMRSDKSPFGVIGMAGNVSEWVQWPKGASFPIFKGGNYKTFDVRLDKRTADHDASKAEEFIGFRTVSKSTNSK